MPTLYELDPVQAESIMQAAQDDARGADNARNAARSRAEEVEREMDAAHDAGDHARVADLQVRHQQAELDLEAAEQEFEAAMEIIGQAQAFWYQEDIGPDQF